MPELSLTRLMLFKNDIKYTAFYFNLIKLRVCVIVHPLDRIRIRHIMSLLVRVYVFVCWVMLKTSTFRHTGKMKGRLK